jgi:hypothetical protein
MKVISKEEIVSGQPEINRAALQDTMRDFGLPDIL